MPLSPLAYSVRDLSVYSYYICNNACRADRAIEFLQHTSAARSSLFLHGESFAFNLYSIDFPVLNRNALTEDWIVSAGFFVQFRIDQGGLIFPGEREGYRSRSRVRGALGYRSGATA